MPRRWLLALTLAAGCGGVGGSMTGGAAGDGGTAADADAAVPDRHGDLAPEARPEVGAGDGAGGGDALDAPTEGGGGDLGDDRTPDATDASDGVDASLPALCPASIPAVTVGSTAVKSTFKGSDRKSVV